MGRTHGLEKKDGIATQACTNPNVLPPLLHTPVLRRLPRILAETTGLTLRLHERDNVILADGSDDVADHGARGLEQLDANLGDTSAGASAAEALDDTGVIHLFLQNYQRAVPRRQRPPR